MGYIDYSVSGFAPAYLLHTVSGSYARLIRTKLVHVAFAHIMDYSPLREGLAIRSWLYNQHVPILHIGRHNVHSDRRAYIMDHGENSDAHSRGAGYLDNAGAGSAWHSTRYCLYQGLQYSDTLHNAAGEQLDHTPYSASRAAIALYCAIVL